MTLPLGTVVAIPLPSSGFGYARVYSDDQLGVYDLVTTDAEPASEDQVTSVQIGHVVCVDLDRISSKGRPIGRHPFRKKADRWGPKRLYCGSLVYDGGRIRPPRGSEAEDLAVMQELEPEEVPAYISHVCCGTPPHASNTPTLRQNKPAANEHSLFLDNIAAGVRNDYLELRADGMSRSSATKRIKSDYQPELADSEDRQRVILALAVTQLEEGRPLSSIRKEALEVIRSADFPDSVSTIAHSSTLFSDLLALLEK